MPKLTEYLFEKLGKSDDDSEICSTDVGTVIESSKRSKYWIRNALGNTVYIYKRDRKDAQKVVDEYFGKGRYTVNCN